jgi:hypothetical protein
MRVHQTVRHNIENGNEVLPHPPQEKEEILALEKDALSIVAAIVQVVIFAWTQVNRSLWHLPPSQTSEVSKTSEVFDCLSTALYSNRHLSAR